MNPISSLPARDSRWYLPEYADERAVKLQAAAHATFQEDQPRRENFARYWSLYSNIRLPGLTPRRWSQRLASMNRGTLAVNVIASTSDALCSKLTNQQPMVTFSTFGGDWDLQTRAEALEKFNNGQVYETELYRIAPQLSLDSCVFGTGVLKIYAEGSGDSERIACERIMPFNLWCDEGESFLGLKYVRTLFEKRPLDRVQAMTLFPEAAERLALVQANDYDDEDAETGQTTDQVYLVESWHLPSADGAEDGRHVIACGDILLLDEPWTKRHFPFVFLYLAQPQSGIWGRGLAYQLEGLQYDINNILNMIRAAIRMSGTVRWMIETGSNVNTQYISDIIGSMIRYTGTPPTAVTPPAVAQEVYEQLRWLISEAYQLSGVSELSARSEKPAGLNSGKAMQTYADIESERFQVSFREYQHFFLQVARQFISLAREIGERNPRFAVKAVNKKLMEVVRWADINLDEEKYQLQLQESNAFARTPTARLQQVQDLVNGGAIDPRTARRLLGGIPDLEEEDSYENSSYNLTMMMVTDIIQKGDYQPPEPFMNLQDSIRLAQYAYLRARVSRVREDRLEMLRTWIQQARDLLPPPPPPAPPPGPPQQAQAA